MHALSVPTWFIHILTVFEWTIAIFIIAIIAKKKSSNKHIILMAFAMLPNLASAMAAITWHIYDNDVSLKGLVYLQALLTFIGNCTLAYASWRIAKGEEQIA